jgi:coenzyme F420 hydrogenase subunit beta
MMKTIHTLSDVVDSGLCCGCGACLAHCGKSAVSLINDEKSGIRPLFADGGCGDCGECLSFCPGAVLKYRMLLDGYPGKYHPLIGPYLEVWDGYAEDDDTRRMASSGGALSALSLYCLEKEGMELVLHTSMDKSEPWRNRTVPSRSRKEILENAGSRYAPSSPCDALGMIEKSERSSVFIGKPCDAAAVYSMRRVNKKLDDRLGLVLSFFCAGPPATKATLDLLQREGVGREAVNSIQYRGNGWPGLFSVRYDRNQAEKTLTYKQAWGYLASHRRPFRCSVCPDGMGEFADISCGDAWHNYKDNGDPGQSTIIVRTLRGKEILSKAVAAGYLKVHASDPERVLSAQGLQKRKKELYGRLLAMALTALPRPDYDGFPAKELWQDNPLPVKIRTLAGTVRRIITRHYMKKVDL